MQDWARYAGRLQAEAWFQNKQYRFLEPASHESTNSAPLTQFTGRKENGVEIWTWRSYRMPWLLFIPDADGVFVDSFNQHMKRLLQPTNNADGTPINSEEQ